MTKFKVGDKVKLLKDSNAVNGFEIGKIYTITETEIGGNYKYEIDRGDGFVGFVNEEHIELAEPQITSKINIDSSGIKLTCDDLQTKKLIIDRNQELYDWWEALKKAKMFPNQENYKNWFMGIWEKDNPTIEKKEGNDMLESLNLVDLYASKQKEKIESETNKKVEELKEKSEIINKFNELKEKFKKDCDELYLSQFTEEEKSEILLDKEPVDDRDKQLIRDKAYLYDYHTNDDFKSSEYYDLMNESNKEINKINELVKTVKAHVGIAKTKEEVEEILTRYEILDKKGKLKI